MNNKIKFKIVLILMISFSTITSCGTKKVTNTLFATATLPTSQVNNKLSEVTDCTKILNNNKNEQIDFNGIIPGYSTQVDVIEKFGKPKDTFLGTDGTVSLGYSQANIVIKDGIVYWIEDMEHSYSINSMITNYGCPDAIITSINDEELRIVDIVYNRFGIDFMTFDNPVTGKTIVYPIYYSPMDSVLVFMKSSFFENVSDTQITTWDEISQ